MEVPKAKSFCCPICGNKDHYIEKFINAVQHWHELKDGVKIDYEHDLELRDSVVISYTCAIEGCSGEVQLNDSDKIKLAIAEPQ